MAGLRIRTSADIFETLGRTSAAWAPGSCPASQARQASGGTAFRFVVSAPRAPRPATQAGLLNLVDNLSVGTLADGLPLWAALATALRMPQVMALCVPSTRRTIHSLQGQLPCTPPVGTAARGGPNTRRNYHATELPDEQRPMSSCPSGRQRRPRPRPRRRVGPGPGGARSPALMLIAHRRAATKLRWAPTGESARDLRFRPGSHLRRNGSRCIASITFLGRQGTAHRRWTQHCGR